MNKPRLFAVAGSTRRDSLNRKLLLEAAEAARQSGAEVDLVDLNDYPLPFYDGDLEQRSGHAAAVRELRERMKRADVLMIASPEYNSSYPAVLKNAIDWVSRACGEDPMGVAFQGRTFGIMAASPSQYGGLRGLTALRTLLENMGSKVVAGQVALASAHQKFDEQGRLVDEGDRAAVKALVAELLATVPVAVPA